MSEIVIINGIEFHVDKQENKFSLEGKQIGIWYKCDEKIYTTNIPEQLVSTFWNVDAKRIVEVAIRHTTNLPGVEPVDKITNRV